MTYIPFIRDVIFDWDKLEDDCYVKNIDALKRIDQINFHKPITFFVGENGTGKSTLLEAIAIKCGLNPEGGTKNYSFHTHDDYSNLYQAITLIRGVRREEVAYFLRAESFYNVATKEEEYAGSRSMKLHEKSHGESFLTIANEYINCNGLYLFDEPEAALSPQRQLSLFLDIYNAAKSGAQFIIASHSPILMGIPDAEILSFDESKIHTCDYKDTESYKITEMFINNRESLLRRLLEEE